jgi:N-methylhydantoinase A
VTPQVLRLGVDIGGTFTDLVLADPATGALWNGKVLTTPADPALGVLEGVRQVLALANAAPEAVAQVIHGTTLVANAIIERKGVRTGFVTTHGFRDVLEMAREWRWDIFDLDLQNAAPLVPRARAHEVMERLGPDGQVITPFDQASAGAVAQALAAQDVQAVAVCFLHAFRNSTHEQAMRAVLARHLPGVAVSLSSEVAPGLGEFERASTTVANAYVQPVFERYLGHLRAGLSAMGIGAELLLMQSDGGTLHHRTAMRVPIRLVQSGPAGGAAATALFGRLAGLPDLIAFDMGGTTAKACLIQRGEPGRTAAFEVARLARFRPGSGLPLLVPAVDMIEIGAGGGSIARVNALGVIAVGPESASAAPGPACYGLGGTDPTVTDADLVLGYLDAGSFLGGAMQLDREAAEEAINRAIARPLGLSVVQAALGIRAVVGESMAQATAMHALEKGVRVADLVLAAIGGAGPVHAADVARRLGVATVLCPAGAGVASALGFLASPASFAATTARIVRLAALDGADAAATFAPLAAQALANLAEAGLDLKAARLTHLIDLRYRGQGHAVEVAVPAPEPGRAWRDAVAEEFAASYQALYGRTEESSAIEAVAWRLIASGPTPALRPPPAAGRTGGSLRGARPVYCDLAGGFVETPVHDRAAMAPGQAIAGPAIIEERESTAVVPAQATATLDAAGNLILHLADTSQGETP